MREPWSSPACPCRPPELTDPGSDQDKRGLGIERQPAHETPEPDLARIVSVLDRHRVEYLIVGGHATRAYGAQRMTHDSDCLVKTGRENLERLAAALRELNARLRVSGLSDEESAALPIPPRAVTQPVGKRGSPHHPTNDRLWGDRHPARVWRERSGPAGN